MNCYKHNDINAEGACVECGNLFCEDCLVPINGKNHCKDCVTKIHIENKKQSQLKVKESKSSNLKLIKIIAGVVSILFCLSIIIKFQQVNVLMHKPGNLLKSYEIKFMWGYFNSFVSCIILLILSIVSMFSRKKLNTKVIIVLILGFVFYIGSAILFSIIEGFIVLNYFVLLKYFVINALILNNYNLNKNI